MGFELPMLQSCCCGCTLRTGSKIIGWFYLIGGIMFTCMFVGFVYVEETNTSPAVATSLMFTEIITNTVQTVASFLLLLGAYQGKKKFVSYWLIANTAVVVINTIILIIYLFLSNIGFSIANILAMFLEFYFLLVVYSYYRDMTDSTTFSV